MKEIYQLDQNLKISLTELIILYAISMEMKMKIKVPVKIEKQGTAFNQLVI